jgi:hypothetical protein
MDEFSARILVALVEGYHARAGLKDRNRALTEYEIARRAGYTEFNYVQFAASTERDQVRSALDELERNGWIQEWQRAGRYYSFVPTDLGVAQAGTAGLLRDADPRTAPPGGDAHAVAAYGAGLYSPPASSPAPAEPPAAPLTAAALPSPLGQPSLGATRPLPPEAALNRLVEQLDEALTLLRAIDAKLGRDR